MWIGVRIDEFGANTVLCKKCVSDTDDVWVAYSNSKLGTPMELPRDLGVNEQASDLLQNVKQG